MEEVEEKIRSALIKILAKNDARMVFSVTSLYTDIEAAQNEFASIKDYLGDSMDDLLLFFGSQRELIGEKLGVPPAEKKPVAQIIAKINTDVFLEKHPESISHLNKVLSARNIKFVAPKLDKELWQTYIIHARAAQAGIVNIHLFQNYEAASDISAFAQKYLKVPLSELNKQVISVETDYNKYISCAPSIDAMRPIATKRLLQLGHLRTSLDNLEILHLGQILYREMLAAKYTLSLRASGKYDQQQPTSAALVDHIAICLVKESTDELS